MPERTREPIEIVEPILPVEPVPEPAMLYMIVDKKDFPALDAEAYRQYKQNTPNADGTGMGGETDLEGDLVAMVLTHQDRIKYFADCDVKDKRGRAVDCEPIFTEKQREEKAVERIPEELRKPVERKEEEPVKEERETKR